ncbi:MAG: protein phosphatase 2C domain-containing protein, partial [Sulfobacillus sp.]
TSFRSSEVSERSALAKLQCEGAVTIDSTLPADEGAQTGQVQRAGSIEQKGPSSVSDSQDRQPHAVVVASAISEPAKAIDTTQHPTRHPVVSPRLRPRRRLVVRHAASEDGVLKDQDRVWAADDGTACCVADGVSSSPYGGEAAEIAVGYVRHNFSIGVDWQSVEEWTQALRRELTERRRLSQDKEFSFSNAHTPAMREYLEAAFREKLKISYQTTLCAVQISVLNEPEILMLVCGDSVALFFDAAGELIWTVPPSLSVDSSDGASKLIVSKGNLTRVLPDDEIDHTDAPLDKLSRGGRLPAHIVLATDGFYNSFETAEAMLNWLRMHEVVLRDRLASENAQKIMEDLHGVLHAKRGDDDISFAWISLEEVEGHAV